MRKPEAILVMGPTGSGKTPLGCRMEAQGLFGRRVHHFDFGAELRSIALSPAPPEGFSAEEHGFLNRVIEHGLLLENEHFPIAAKILSLFVARRQFDLDRDRLLLNGLPRHRDQAIAMDSLVDVTHLILLECEPELVLQRIVRNTGGDRGGRTDDTHELIIKKMGIYRERTEPLVHHYKRRGVGILRVKVREGSETGEICDRLAADPAFSQ